ncbi:MAG: anti-sigma factor antagonist [Clostridia bacterium]|nr:anti-sigma factor antagonist [Clostridia bacterium]
MQVSVISPYRLLYVQLAGELDHHCVSELRSRLDGELIRSGVRNLALDFSGVGFMDSSGLGLIMGRHKLVSALGGRLIVCGMNESTAKLFKMCGLQRIAIVADNIDDGIKELSE